MSNKKLVVAGTPSNNLSHTNIAYVNEKEFSDLPLYVKICDTVLIIQSHPKITDGCIGLNRIQRQTIKVSNNDVIDVEIYCAPKYGNHIVYALLEIDYYDFNRVINDKIDTEKFINMFLNKYRYHIFTKRQTISTEFEGEVIIVQFKDTQIEGDIGGEKIFGLLVDTSIIHIVKSGKSKMEFCNTSNNNYIKKENEYTNDIFNTKISFEQLGIGGLDKQLNNVFRRAFASRIYPSAVIDKLGIKHVKGIILYGPPGTGKTLIARQIGKILKCHEPKVINGPEILNKYVGQSEENIRNIFQNAESEYKEKGNDSNLHLIIFDELDAICKQRGSNSGGTGVQDSVVNQLLSKMDGVNSLNNILIIGMTNRLDMLDEALLRPGRFEVQMEIGLPNEEGRLQILKIHTKEMDKNKYLDRDVDFFELSKSTENYSGAEIEGLVKSASSFALNRQIDLENTQKKFDEKNIKITANDFAMALSEIKPAFGISSEELEFYLSQEIINYGASFDKLVNTCRSFIKQIKNSNRTNMLSILLNGSIGSGKTTLAAFLAQESGFSYVKILSADKMIGFSEQAICNIINKTFQDAYKSQQSIIIIDNIERLIQLVHIGPRFSNTILQALLVLVKRQPPSGKKLLIVGTSSLCREESDLLDTLEISNVFSVIISMPQLTKQNIRQVCEMSKYIEEYEKNNIGHFIDPILEIIPESISIKKLLLVIEMACTRTDMENDPLINKFEQSINDCCV